MPEAVIVAAARTPIGRAFKGSLREFRPDDLSALIIRAALDQLIVINGAITAAFNHDKKTSYAELIGGRYFNVQLDWNKQWGNPLYAPGKAQPKPHTAHRIVGQPIRRACLLKR